MSNRRAQTPVQDAKLEQIGDAWEPIRDLILAIWSRLMAERTGVDV